MGPPNQKKNLIIKTFRTPPPPPKKIFIYSIAATIRIGGEIQYLRYACFFLEANDINGLAMGWLALLSKIYILKYQRFQRFAMGRSMLSTGFMCSYQHVLELFQDNRYVSLWDPESMKLLDLLEQSPQDWKTTTGQNVVLTVFHTQNICHHLWKTLRTPLLCFVLLISQGEG